MKKSVISLMLTLSLLLGTVLGCFSLPVAAAESAASAASITDVKSAVVGPELQVVVNATDAKSYKLYENGTCVAESEYPIIVYGNYDAAKTYGVSAVDENGNETAVTNIAKNDIAEPDVNYNAENILAGKPLQMTEFAKQWAHSNATVKDWNSMTDGNHDTRYSVTNKLDAVIDGVVELGGSYTLGELRLYDYEGSGTARTCGNRLIIEIYSNGRWVEVANYDRAEMQANHSKLGYKKGYISVDLFGYNGEAIRIYNDGMTVANDCLSYWEFTLGGVLTSTEDTYYSDVHGNIVESGNVFSGKSFTVTDNTKINWMSGGGSNPAAATINNTLKNITDGNVDTTCKVTGSYLEYEIDLTGNEYMINEITVFYQHNNAMDDKTGYRNNHYNSGMDVTISAYVNGEWKVVYTEEFTDNRGSRTFSFNGVVAEKIRYYCKDATVWFWQYDADGNAVTTDAEGNPIKKSSEGALGIAEIIATGIKFDVKTELEESDNVFAGETFVQGANSGAVWGGSYTNLTDNSLSTVVKTHDRAEAILDFGNIVRLDTLTVKYSSGLPRRCGSGLLIELTYAGVTYVAASRTYDVASATATFELGGMLAESVRIYVPGLHPDTKVDENTTDNCIEILEISCTGAKRATTFNKSNNILAGITMTAGPAATAVHAADYGYQTLTDGSMDSKTGRFSTVTANGVVMDANADFGQTLHLGELRIYDFEPNANTRVGSHLQIMLLQGSNWNTVYDLYGSDIYAHRVGNHLSFDLNEMKASAIRIIARQTEQSISVTVYEIELTATAGAYEEEKQVADKEYEGNNILLGIPAENTRIIANGSTVSMHPSFPLNLAFDGIIEPDATTKNRYATQGSMTAIKDASGNQIGAYYYLEIDLENATRLYTLSVYEWRAGGSVTRSNKTSIEVKINGAWVKVIKDVSLSTDSKVDRTDFDLGGVVASGIRITFLNDYYEGHVTQTGLWPTPTIKEITCTGEVSYGDLLDAFESIDAADTSAEFGLDEVKNQKLEALKAELMMAGATPAEMLAKINEFKAIANEFANGSTPVTDAYGDFKQANISLEGDIGFNFYGALDANVEEQFPNASVVVRYNTVTEGVVTTNTEVVKLSELAKDGSGRYVVNFGMAAAQMTDDVEIRLVLDGDNCGEHITWSVKDYCDVILAGDYDQKLKDVVTAMLNYGAYAQSYFGYKTDDLAADLSGLGSVTETAKPVVAGSVSGVNLNRWTLTLDSNVTMKLYFTLDGVNPEDLTVTVTGPDGSVTTVDALELVGARYRVTINDITSGYLNDNYVVTVTAGEETLTVTSSAMCYVSGVLAMENPDPALVNLVTALKLYSVAADAYFGK